jgi:hypothetical protein
MVVTTKADEEAADDTFESHRDPKMKTAQINSAPHPELWPAPLTPKDAEPPEDSEEAITVVPASPNVNLEYTMKASGLPVNPGLTWHLTGAEPETWLTHKSDPNGDAHIVWRTRGAGTVNVEIFTREPLKTGEKVVNTSFEVLDPAEDRRLGEERGAG